MVGDGRMDAAVRDVDAAVVRTDVPVGGSRRNPEDGARWVSLSRVCTLAGIRRSSTAQAAWQSLVSVAESGSRPHIEGRPVRMTFHTIKGVGRWCMDITDARGSASSLKSLVARFRDEERASRGRSYSAAPEEWLDQRAAFQLSGAAVPDEDFRMVWYTLSAALRNGREPRLFERSVRTKVFLVGGSRRLHVHRDDVDLVAQAARPEIRNRYLELGECAAHFRRRFEADHARIALRFADALVDLHKRTGCADLDGIPVRMGLHVSALPALEAAVCSFYDTQVLRALDRNVVRDPIEAGTHRIPLCGF